MIVMMMMITVMLIEAVYEIISATDSWHFLFLVHGHDGDDDDNSGDDRGCIWNNKCHGFVTLMIFEDGHDGDDDDNSDDDRGCIWN